MKKKGKLERMNPPRVVSPPANSYYNTQTAAELNNHLKMYNTLNVRNERDFKQAGR